MKKRIFVTATNTNIGKTYTTKLLLQEYASRDIRVGVIKLIETGVVDGIYPDGNELLCLVKKLNPEFIDVKIEDIVPISYELAASPFVASGAKSVDFELLGRAIDKLEKLCDVLIIEGSGGLCVPLDKNFMIIDLISFFRATTLLVTHCSLGCINDTLLSLNLLTQRDISAMVAFNYRESDLDFEKISEPYFIGIGYNILKIDSDIDTICDVLYNP